MQVALAPLMQERWRTDGITVHTMHPGWADTPGVASSLPLFKKVTGPVLRDATAGADTVVWLAATEPAPPWWPVLARQGGAAHPLPFLDP